MLFYNFSFYFWFLGGERGSVINEFSVINVFKNVLKYLLVLFKLNKYW